MKLTTMEYHKNGSMDIPTSSAMLCFHLMETMLCLDHGIRLFVCGIWLLENQLVVLKTIPRCGISISIIFGVLEIQGSENK